MAPHPIMETMTITVERLAAATGAGLLAGICLVGGASSASRDYWALTPATVAKVARSHGYRLAQHPPIAVGSFSTSDEQAVFQVPSLNRVIQPLLDLIVWRTSAEATRAAHWLSTPRQGSAGKGLAVRNVTFIYFADPGGQIPAKIVRLSKALAQA
jgi:hypothetical protein